MATASTNFCREEPASSEAYISLVSGDCVILARCNRLSPWLFLPIYRDSLPRDLLSGSFSQASSSGWCIDAHPTVKFLKLGKRVEGNLEEEAK